MIARPLPGRGRPLRRARVGTRPVVLGELAPTLAVGRAFLELLLQRVFNLGGSPVSIEAWIGAIDEAVPGARELLTFEPIPLPFPADIQHDRLAELGAAPVTPYREAIASTARIFQQLASEGLLVGTEQGVPAATAAAQPAPAAASSA